jgi:CRISPR-associated protein Cas5t
MRVLHVELDGVTTSFRLPHVHVGRQVTYPLPPPATILGHIASALGDWPDPAGIRFAYSFTSVGRVDDVEATYVTEVGGSVPREEKARFPHPVNVSGAMNPYLRELLVRPHLDLYLDAGDRMDAIREAFRSPRYMVVFGRSQDLGGYRRVEAIETEEADRGYVEGSLLQTEDGARFRTAFPMIMPRYIDPADRRRVAWGSYLLLDGRATVTPDNETGPARARTGPHERFDIDPGSPPVRDLRRILVWHSFVEGAVRGDVAGPAR